MISLPDHKKEVTQSARQFFSGTLLSRLLGLSRDIAMAYAFGSHTAIAALMVAFRWSNLLRRVFGEGALHAAFVPIYERETLHSKKAGASFFVNISYTLVGILLLFTLVLEGSLYLLLKRGVLSEANEQIATLSFILFPSILFICHSAFCSSLLQCEKHFFLPAASPLSFNFLWILGIAFSFYLPIHKAVEQLACFIFLGFFAQWLLLFPVAIQVLKSNVKEKIWKTSLREVKASFKVMQKPFLLGIIGVSTSQINNALDAFFARVADPHAPAYLWYALRLEQLPLAIFGVALAGALLPSLSRAFSKHKDEFKELLDFSLVRSWGLLMPCMSALIFIGPAALNLLFARGHFDEKSLHETILCLWGYGAGLGFQGLALILASAFYAQGKYKETTLATFYSMVMNVILNGLFAFYFNLGAWSIAVATTLSAGFQVGFLLSKLNLGSYFVQFKRSLFIVTAISLLAGVMMHLTFQCACSPSIFTITQFFPKEFFSQLFFFLGKTSLFLFYLFGLAKLFQVGEILELLNYIPKWVRLKK